MELWLRIKDFPNYEVSSNGRVKNTKTGRILKQQKNDRGYSKLTLRRDNRQYDARVHRLVADTFYDGEHEGLDVNHIDGNKQNNFIGNLEFCTRKENIRHSFDIGLSKPHDARGVNNGRCILTEDDVRYIRSHYEYRDSEFGGSGLAKKFNVSTSAIYNILYGTRWTDID